MNKIRQVINNIIKMNLSFIRKYGLVDFSLTYFICINYLLVVPSVIIGVFSDNLGLYYIIFSMFFVILFVFISGCILLYLSQNISHYILILKENIFDMVPVLIWGIYLGLIVLYTPIFKNWDAIASFLPMAKSIVMTGSLKYSPLFLSEVPMGFPPLSPISYSIIIKFLGDEFLKLFPLVYLIFILLVVYKLNSIIFNNNNTLLVIFLFLLLPTTQMLFGRASLFLDLAFVFYLICSTYIYIKLIEKELTNNIWCLLFGMSTGLLFMSKEYGISLSIVMFALYMIFYINAFKNIYFKYFFSIVIFIPNLLLSFYDIVTAGNIIPLYTISRLFSVIIFITIYTIFMNTLTLPGENNKKKRFNKFLCFITPIILSSIYLIYNIIVRKIITPTIQYGIVQILYNMNIPIYTSLELDIKYLDFIRIDKLISSYPFIIYNIPLIISMIYIYYDLKKKVLDYKYIVCILLFLNLLNIWQFRGFPIGGDNFRILVPLSLFTNIILIYKYQYFPTQLKHDFRMKNQLQFLLFTVSYFVMWFIMEPVHENYLLYSNIANSRPSESIYDLLFYSVIYMPYVISIIFTFTTADDVKKFWNFRVSFKVRKLEKIRKIIFVLLIGVNTLLPSYLVFRSSSIISQRTWNPNFYGNVLNIRYFYDEPLVEIADFYANSIDNQFVTMTFGMDRLAYILERPFLDLTYYDQLSIIAPILNSNNSKSIIDMLIKNNIKYFLLPMTKHWAFPYYNIYINYTLFKMVIEEQWIKTEACWYKFVLEKRFLRAEVNLYELQIMNTTEIVHLYRFKNNPLIISDDDQSYFYKSSTSNIKISDINTTYVHGENSLKIDNEQHISTHDEHILYVFDSKIDLSNKEFIALYWYGNATSQSIIISLWTGSWNNDFEFGFVDTWKGWARLIIPLTNFEVCFGSPSWDNITAIAFYLSMQGESVSKVTYYLDHVIADVGISKLYIIPEISKK